MLGLSLGLCLGQRRRGGTPAIITADTAPQLVAADDTDTPADVFTTGSYSSSAGTIDTVTTTYLVNGSAEASSYDLAAGDTLQVRELVTGSAGNSQTFSTGLVTVALSEALSNTTPPEITGTTAVGNTLSASQGTWAGSAPRTYSYQWTRDGAEISGATSSTYTLVAADEGAEIGVEVTADDGFTTATVGANLAWEAEASPTLSDQTLVRGQEVNLDLTSALGGTDGVTATGLPEGIKLSGATLSGYALSFCPARTVTVSRGGIELSAEWGVTPHALWPVPLADAGSDPFPNIDIATMDAQNLWDTIVFVGANSDADTDRTALVSAINTAAADTGNAGSEKYHKIVYQGAHIDEATNPDLVASGTADPNTVIAIYADHPTDDFTRASQVLVRARPVFVGWETHGSGAAGSYVAGQHPNYIDVSGAETHYQFVGCRFGAWWLRLNYATNTNTSKLRFQTNASAVAERCQFAGLYGGINAVGANAAIIDCTSHNLTEDMFRYFFQDGNASENLVYRFGNVDSRVSVIHRDDLSVGNPHIDIGTQFDLGSDEASRANYQTGYNIGVADAGLYASTGYRLNGTGSGADLSRMGKVIAENDILMFTGYDGAVVQNAESFSADGLVLLPPPGLPALDMRLDFNTVDAVSLSNVVFTNFLDESATPTGVDIRLGQQTSGAGDSIDTIFPNYTGAVETFEEYVAGDYFVPDHINFSHHPNSIRQALSAALVRGGSWDSALNPISDPATWGRYDWGTPPAVSAPSLSSLSASMDASTATASVNVDVDCRLHWTVSEENDTPNPVAARQHRLSDGRAAGPNTGDAQDIMPDRGVVIADAGTASIPIDRSRLSADTNYYLIVVAESEDGGLSDVVVSEAFSYAAPSAEITQTQLLSYKGSAGGKTSLETTAFSPTGAIIVDVHSRSDQVAALGIASITIGAAGRTLGTGTPLTAIYDSNAGRSQVWGYYLTSPSAGSQTIQIQFDGSSVVEQVVVTQVGNFGGIGPNTLELPNSGSPTSQAFSLTTTATDSVVRYAMTNLRGEDVAWTGATELYEDGFSTLFRATGASEVVPSVGEATATATWTTSSNVAGGAFEILKAT